jgi:hypothetical protein
MALFQCTNCVNQDKTPRVFEADAAYMEARQEDRDAKNSVVPFCPHCGAPRSKCEPA